MNDLKFAIRQLLKNPGFAIVAVFTLALGIGATTTTFTFVNSIVLRPLPFKDADRLVVVYENYAPASSHRVMVTPPTFAEWRKQSTVFEALAVRGFLGQVLTGRGDPEGLQTGLLSANIFSLLRVKPMIGRDFLPDEDIPGKNHVVLLSYELWNRRFGGDNSILGQSVTLSDERYTVIGVMPPRTFFPDQNTQLWTPLVFTPEEANNMNSHNYQVYGRLKPGVTLAKANSEMKLIATRMERQDGKNKGWGAEVEPLHAVVVGNSKRTLLVLLGSVTAVLLIGCANIAGLLLARASGRSREFAIRVSLGARRGQIMRQLLTESVLLALLGGVAGTILAWISLPVLVHFCPPDMPRIAEGVRIHGWILGFTALVSLATGIGFGLIPALQTGNSSLAVKLNESSRGSSSGGQQQHFRQWLATGQVAFSLMLLIGAGLLIRSFDRLLSQDLGYNPEHLVSLEIGLTDRYSEGDAPARFFSQLLSRIVDFPQVRSAALVAGLPLARWDANVAITVDGMPPRAPNEATAAHYAQISPGYFSTMNIPLLKGRAFTEQDRSTTPTVVIVNETFAREFHLGDQVIGQTLSLGDGAKHAEIVGVVKDTKRGDLADRPSSEMYRPFQQACWGQMRLIVRTQAGENGLARLVRTQLDTIDKDVPILNVSTMAQLLASSVAERRMLVQLLGGFAAIALFLALVGLYGVLSYQVAQRSREIGIRIALGAQRADALRLVLREGLVLTAAGVVVGVIGAYGLTRVLRSLLYEMSPTDPASFLIIPILLIAVAFVACWFPARSATKIDPIEALRNE
jgi:putative ABC transport system permease protein